MNRDRRHRWVAGGMVILANVLLVLVMVSYASAGGGGSSCTTEMDKCHCDTEPDMCTKLGSQANDACIHVPGGWVEEGDSTRYFSKIFDELSEEFIDEPCPGEM